MTWRVARSLDVLLETFNDHAPTRSKVSDGSIGDAAHATRDSDHNPWVIYEGMGIVRARDFTHDPDRGADAGVLAEGVRLLGLRRGHRALATGAYVIWDRRIASASHGWVWRPYTGSNPHSAHCHVSVTTVPVGFDSSLPWDIYEPEDDMADYASQLDRIEATQARILERLAADAVIRSRLSALVAQGRADARELADLRDLLESVAPDRPRLSADRRAGEPR